MRIIGFALLLTSTLLLTSGCEEKKETNLFKAQSCLDKATPANVDLCTAMIEGQTSKRAYVIFCSARFLTKGLDETSIATTIEQMNDDDSTDPTSGAISSLAMPDDPATPTSYDVAFATATAADCALTESAGLIALSQFALVATTTANVLSNFVGSCAPGDQSFPLSESCVKDAIDNYVPGSVPAGDKAALGQSILDSKESLCGVNGLFKDDAFCTDVNAATANNATAEAVADALIPTLDN